MEELHRSSGINKIAQMIIKNGVYKGIPLNGKEASKAKRSIEFYNELLSVEEMEGVQLENGTLGPDAA